MKFLSDILVKAGLVVEGSTKVATTTGGLIVGGITDAGFKADVVGTARVQNRLTLTHDIYFSNYSTTGIIITGPNVVYPLIVIGSNNTTSGNTNIIIGQGNQGTGASYIFGSSNIGNSNGSVIVGQSNQANTSGQYTVLIGGSNTTSHAVTTFTGMFAIGNSNVLAHQASSIMGSNQTTTANNQLIFASTQSNVNSAGFNDIYFGTGPRSKNTNLLGSNIVINGSGAGAGTDLSGGNVTIAGGKGTGAGTPGDVIISTASTTTSGTTLQSLTQRLRIAATTGNVTVATLAGTGTRMVVADSSGVLSTQTVPSGSVTSVGLSLPNIFSVTGSPVTTSGTLTATLENQNANLVFAGPTTGTAAAPTFRSLVAADIPALSYEPVITAGTTAQYWRGDKSWQDLNTAVRGAISLTTTNSSGAATYNSTTGVFNIPQYTFNGLSPMTTLGDIIYGGAAGAGTRLAGNTTTTKQFLSQTGTGTVSAAPSWSAVTKSDVGLGNVENTALSTWAGSTNITTLGTITSGTWSASTIAIARGGTGATTAIAAFDALSPLTTLGDTIYHDGTDNVRLAGNTTTTRKFLRQTGTGTVSAAPAWDTLVSGDIPNNAANTTGSAATLTTARTLTIGATGKTFNGSANVSWSLAEIGAQAALTNPITGDGTEASGNIAYFTGNTSIAGSATFTYTPTSALLVNNSVTAATAIARGINFTPTLVAAANNDVLVGLDISPSYTNGAFTGVTNTGLRITVASGDNIQLVKSGGPALTFKKTAATAQEWQVAGEDNFKIYDITASTVPFQIAKTTGTTTFGSGVEANGRVNLYNNNGYGFAHYSSSTANNQYLITQHISASNGFLFTTGKNGTPAIPYLALGTGDAEKMRITSGGLVGIGETSPEATLHVSKSNAGSLGGQLIVDNPSASTVGNTVEISFLTDAGASGTGNRNARILVVNENAGNGAANMQFHTWDGAASAQRVVITSGGNVIIGNGDSSATPVVGVLRGTNGSGTNISGGELRFAGGRGTGTGAGGVISFYTAAAGTTGSTLNATSEKMSINGAGTLRLNNYTTNGLLYVSGSDGTVGAAARAINGTTFDGSVNIVTNYWGTARTLTIGATGKSVDGSANVSWTLAEIGAQAALTNPITGDGTETAGNIAYFTGNTAIAGNASLFWDTTNGRLGVGTNTPNLTIDARGNAAIGGGATASTIAHGIDANGRYLMVSGSGTNPNYGIVWVVNNTTEATGQSLGAYMFGQSVSSKTGTNAGTKAAITAVSSGSGGTVGGFGGELRFATRPDNAANDIGTYTRLTIASTGAATFSSTVTATQFISTVSSGTNIELNKGTGPSIAFNKTNATAQSWLLSADPNINFYNATSATTPFVITTGGNVGIGETSPYSKLEIKGSATSYANSPSITFTDSSGVAGSNRWIAGNIATDYGSFNIASADTPTGTTWTPRITITSAGNVGINTSSPKLNSNNGTFTTISNASAGAWLELATGSTTNDVGGIITFNNTNIVGTDKRNAYIGGVRDGANNSGALIFGTWSAGTSGERMRIINSGEVGINITPTAGNRFWVRGSDSTSSNTALIAQNSSSAWLLYVRNDGNIGINTNSPEALLHVNKSNAGGAGGYIYVDNPAASTIGNSVGIRFGTSSGASFASVYTGEISNIVTNNSNGASDLLFGTFNGTSSGERMRIAASGNLLIGETSDASSKLVVRKDAAGARGGEISIVNYSASTLNSSAALNFGLEASTYDADLGNAQIKAQITNAGNSASDMIFSTWNGSAFGERFRIASAGAATFQSSVTASSFFEPSDLRLKNVIERDPKIALDIALVKYEKKESSGVRYGYIAQDVQALMPELVNTGEYLSLNYQDIHSIKIAALEREIKELKAKLNALE